ncbi:unnamed protein product [Urochloa humidicola]
MRSDSRKGNNQKMCARNVLDEMTTSEFEEWRSPNRILEITIHKVYYPISESILYQIFGQFGKVEDVSVCMGVEHVEAQVIFQSKLEAAEAFGELHGRHIYDDCCQMEIKWGCCNISKRLPAQAAAADLLPAPAPSTTTPSTPTHTALTSLDTTTPTTTTKESVQTAPARCLTAGLTMDESTLVPVSVISSSSSILSRASSAPAAAPTPSLPARTSPSTLATEEEVPNTSPIKCSIVCLSQQRYITSSTPAYSMDTRVWHAQKEYEGIGALKTAMLSILNFEQVCIPPKPPWSLLYIEYDSTKSNIATQVASMPWTHLLVLTENVRLRPIPWPSFREYATATSWQNLLSLLVVNPLADTQLFLCCQMNIQSKPPWVSFCCFESGVIDHMFIQYSQQQTVSTVKCLHGHCIDAIHCQSIVQGNPNEMQFWKRWLTLLEGAEQVCELLQSSHVAIMFELMPSNLILKNMQYVVAWVISLLYLDMSTRTTQLMASWQWSMIVPLKQACSLVPQVGDMAVLSVKSMLVLFMHSQHDVVVKGFLLVILSHSSDYDDELAIARSSNYQVVVVLDILPWHLLPVIRNGQAHALFEWCYFCEGDEKDIVKQWMSDSHKYKIIFSDSCCELGISLALHCNTNSRSTTDGQQWLFSIRQIKDESSLLILSSYSVSLLLWSILLDAHCSLNIGPADLVPLSSSALLIYYVLTQKHIDGSWGYIHGGLFHLLYVSYLQTKVQVTGLFYPVSIAKFLISSNMHLLAVSIAMETKYATSIRHIQAPWDPGGIFISNRLGGKPNLKKGGCQVCVYGKTAKWG